MKKSDQYLKLVEWSDEDQCYIGRIPGLTLGGIHGDDEKKIYAELCDLAEDWIKIYEEEGQPLPPPTAGKPAFRGVVVSPPSVLCSSVAGPLATKRLKPVSGSMARSTLVSAGFTSS